MLLSASGFQETAMIEQCLLSIIDAADPDDREDVAIRRSLATALGNSGIDLADMMNGEILLPTLCELSAIRRKVRRLSRARSGGVARLSRSAERRHSAPCPSAARAQRRNGNPRRNWPKECV
jgi:hypothetical protein